ncbi:DUF1294 domain-containing protein [Piscibacillus halophilus]|uniref:DUF1294 domain-containing protein n=1 Tax=Piscibacillus halophilus TaxID=571933 RepID=UPI00240A07CF|nr:DUF1294 domain-containing protein [Piscibacillus halophilus]
MEIGLLGILVMSLIGFTIMGIDKRKARQGRWRTPEKTLWLIAVLGGAPGMWIGMKLFRHKTKHPLFKFGLPVLTLLIILAVVYMSY